MSKLDDSGPLNPAGIARLRAAGKPLFALGNLYATPAVLEFLLSRGISPASLVERHCRGDYGELDEEDIASNDRAIVVDGNRILSAYLVEGRKIYCITEAVNDQGLRTTSTLLFASEY